MLKIALLLVWIFDLMLGCCIPKQHEVNLEMFDDNPGKGISGEVGWKGLSQYARVHYDAVNMKIAVQHGYMKTIQHFKNGTFYFIDRRAKSCYVSPDRQSFPFICTDTWTKTDSLYFGDGSSKLLAGKYMCSKERGHYLNATIGEEKCSQILWKIIDDDGAGGMSMTVQIFSNLTEGIKDPKVFAPPLYCKTTTAPKERGVLDHFVRLAEKCFPLP